LKLRWESAKADGGNKKGAVKPLEWLGSGGISYALPKSATDPKYKPKVVPTADIVCPVNGYFVIKKACDERYGRNHAVPQAIPKAVRLGSGLDYGRFGASRKQ
jgi:hypothetical protein